MRKIFGLGTYLLLNQAGEGSGGGGGAGAGDAGSQGAQGGDAGQGNAGTQTGLDFIPEAYRQESWASKYKTADDFFKGVGHMAKVVGQKQVVNGIQPPSENSTPEEVEAFYKALGRPESADKYSFTEEIKGPEGYDLSNDKQVFLKTAFENGLTSKQAEGIFKAYVATVSENLTKAKENQTQELDKALTLAFGDDGQNGFDLAKKGAKALGIGTKLDEEGLSTNPLVLQLCAKLGELAKEDSFVDGKSGSDTKESLLEEAKTIQASPEYKAGDKKATARVQEIYKTVYPA